MGRGSFSIGSERIGDDHAPYIIAEAGVHHANSVTLAKEYILQARISGAQAVKFQTYKASRLAARWAPTYWSGSGGDTQYQIFSEREKFGRDEYSELIRFASEVGITFLSTPFDPESVALLDDLGMPAFKIASADLTYVPLLRTVARLGKPVLLSTGASTMAEVQAAVKELRDAEVQIALLHCSLAYPTPLVHANLQRIRMLRDAFPELVIGYSDHTQPKESELACPFAVLLGARVIEKHFTLNPFLPGDDHYHATDPAALQRLVKNCRDAALMGARAPSELTEGEEPARVNARRSVVAARAITKGEPFTTTNLDCKRPGTGLSPGMLDLLIGRLAKRSYTEDELIGPIEFE